MWKTDIRNTILYEDKEIIVCHKPAGLAVQNARIGTMDMESALKNYMAQKNPNEIPYLGIISRLDQPVEGILVFAKSSQSAAGLNRQMEKNEIEKIYLAVSDREPAPKEGALEDYLKKTAEIIPRQLRCREQKAPKRPDCPIASWKHCLIKEQRQEYAVSSRYVWIQEDTIRYGYSCLMRELLFWAIKNIIRRTAPVFLWDYALLS